MRTAICFFTGNPPAAAKQIAAGCMESLPVPVASPAAGQAGSVRPVPAYSRFTFTGPVHVLAHGEPPARVFEEGRIFCVTKACTSCGACEAACPTGNIEMQGKKPAWKDHCGLCLACIRTCPVQAIRVGNKTWGRQQNRQPGTTGTDQKRQREKQP